MSAATPGPRAPADAAPRTAEPDSGPRPNPMHAAVPAPQGATPPGVLFVVPKYPPPLVGGLERQAYELATALARAGAPVQVLSGRVFPGQEAEEVREGVRVRRVADGPGWARPLVQAAAMVRWMYARRAEYQVVHLHNLSWFGFPVLLFARLLGKPVLAKLPSPGRVGGVMGQIERPFGRVWLRVFLRSDAVVALVRENVDEMVALGFPPERIFPITNGVSTARFRPAPGERDPAAPPRVVFVGRLSPEKGLPDLLQVWGSVRARVPGARLDLYGEGVMGDALRAQAAELGLEGSVTFHGDTSDVLGALQGADVLALPSHSEGNSNAMLEAMACGLPIVADRVGGAALLVGAEGEPWLADPRDRDAFADRLAALLASPETRAAVGAAMLRRVERYFEIGVVADAYLRVYRCLAAGERTRVRSLASPLFSP